MELRRYIAILRHQWWIVLGVPLLVLLLSLPGFSPDPERYRTSTTLLVTHDRIADPQPAFADFNNFQALQASQFVVDDLPGVLKSAVFAGDVASWIQRERKLDVSQGTVAQAFEVERDHRIVTLIITAPSAEAAQAIGDGAVAMLQTKGLGYWNRTDSGQLALGLLTPPAAPGALSRWPQPISELILRLILGGLAGVGLGFLRHYLDRTVREASDLQVLDLPALAVIPRES